MRRLKVLTAGLIVLFSVLFGMAAAAAGNVQVKVNDELIAFPDQKPFIDASTYRTYVPVRFVTERLGASVDWNRVDKIATIQKGGRVIEAPVGSKSPTVNGSVVSLDAPVKLVNGRTVVPLRFISEVFGAEVRWEKSTRTVYINMQAEENKEQSTGAKPGDTVVVKASLLNVRSGPATSCPKAYEVLQGDRLTVLEVAGAWYKVEVPGGGSGWVAGWYTEVVSEAGGQEEPGSLSGVVDADSGSVRSGPGDDHEVITRVSRGERLGILEKAGSWYKVQLAGGAVGWIAENLIDVDAAEATTPEQDEQHRKEAENYAGSGDEVEPPPVEEDIDWENADSSLAGLTVREAGGRTLVTVTTTGPVVHDVFTLTGPDRVVLDLKGARTGDVPAEMAVDNALVSRIRSGQFSKEPPVTRLVFDVKKPVLFAVAKQEKGEGMELTVELYVPELGRHLNGKVIAIDPGHGGSEPGAIGPSGLREKEVNLDVALLTANLLRQNGAKVVLTRSADRFVGLYERARIANEAGADVFVSIHMNAHLLSHKDGTSTYYLEDGVVESGVSQADNRLLAERIQVQLQAALGRRNLGIKQANFAVLRTAAMPAVLVEAMFISNPTEEYLLKKSTTRAKIAEAIARGLADYFARKA